MVDIRPGHDLDDRPTLAFLANDNVEVLALACVGGRTHGQRELPGTLDEPERPVCGFDAPGDDEQRRALVGCGLRLRLFKFWWKADVMLCHRGLVGHLSGGGRCVHGPEGNEEGAVAKRACELEVAVAGGGLISCVNLRCRCGALTCQWCRGSMA